MESISNVIAPIFWGVLLLSLLVFVHEGGHFLAARACGVRVTEFFLGLPCRFSVYHASRRIGTRFGVTPLLLGGYAAICGMDPEESPHAADVLDFVHRRGTASVAQIASELSITEEEALDTCAFLLNWGSLAPVYDASKGEGAVPSSIPAPMPPCLVMPLATPFSMGAPSIGLMRRRRASPGSHQMVPRRFLLPSVPTHISARVSGSARSCSSRVSPSTWLAASCSSCSPIRSSGSKLLSIQTCSARSRPVPLLAAAGISEGDRILSVEGDAVATWTEITSSLNTAREAGTDPIELTVWTPDADALAAPEGTLRMT